MGMGIFFERKKAVKIPPSMNKFRKSKEAFFSFQFLFCCVLLFALIPSPLVKGILHFGDCVNEMKIL